MYKISAETIAAAYKPFDVVTNHIGDVGYIQEVVLNDTQKSALYQVSYSVRWLVGIEAKHAWWDHHELKRHCNFFVEIAKASCHPMGGSEKDVEKIFGC